MKRLTIELEEGDHAYLLQRASREGRTVASLMKEAVDLMRRRAASDPGADPMEAIGSFEGPADLSETHDVYLFGTR